MAYAELPEAERRDEARRFAKETVENLFLPALENYGNYPVRRDKAAGGVSGNRSAVNDGWWLSTDVGCAFIPLDGLAEYYAATKDESVGAGISSAAERFGGLDFLGLKMQTHATLSALRGILSFYETTREKKYLELVLEIFGLYLKNGMTLTYENFNWFGREDTWTEPCAVVDSLILAIRLFKITAEIRTPRPPHLVQRPSLLPAKQRRRGSQFLRDKGPAPAPRLYVRGAVLLYHAICGGASVCRRKQGDVCAPRRRDLL